MPDYRVSLEVLNNSWSRCTKCELGQYRENAGSQIVAGDGEVGGVMFIGPSPSKEDDEIGRPFLSESGSVLREAVRQYGFPSYFTNMVCCRACEQATNGAGELVWNTSKRTGLKTPYIVDRPPTLAQMEACKPRIYDEIYLVDPVIVVSLGPDVAKALSTGGHFGGLLNEHGQSREILVPGVGREPALTEKKHVWRRKVGGEMVMPTVQRMVRYLMVPTYHPIDVVRKAADRRKNNITEVFMADIRKVSDIYYEMRKYTHPNETPKQAAQESEESWPE